MPVVVLTEGTQWRVPDDFDSSNNSVECVGGGASGLIGAANGGNGGGGGGYGRKRLTLTPGAYVNYQIGQGNTDGDGTATWFKTSTTVRGNGGKRDGTGGGGIGTTVYTGGAGGVQGGTGGYTGGGGGGGGAGYSGDGSDGVTATTVSGTAGGSGSSGAAGGRGGYSSSIRDDPNAVPYPGDDGDYTAPEGGGGGGGGANYFYYIGSGWPAPPPSQGFGNAGADGGFPGGGGGGGGGCGRWLSSYAHSPGAGANGCIVITYESARSLLVHKTLPKIQIRPGKLSLTLNADGPTTHIGSADLSNSTVWQLGESYVNLMKDAALIGHPVFIENKGLIVAINLVLTEDWELRSFMREKQHAPQPPLPGIPSMVQSNSGIYSITVGPSTQVPDVVTDMASYSIVHKPSQIEVVVMVTKVDNVLREAQVVYKGTTMHVTDTAFVQMLEALADAHSTEREAEFISVISNGN